MFRIITIEREFGSGGGGIAAKLATRLGWKLWDHSLTEEVAKIAKVDCAVAERCDETVDSTLRRLAKVFWRGSHERSAAIPDSGTFDADCMVAMMQQLMTRIAKEGNAVIVGRGSPYFLREHDDALRVFTFAPRDEKIRRLVSQGRDPAEAEELVETVDRERIAYVKHYFGADWPKRTLYHMMINTSIGDDRVIAAILKTMQLLGHNFEAAGSSLRGIALK